MLLVKSIKYGDKIYNECEIKKPSPSILADTRKIVDDNRYFAAMLVFVTGCITTLTSIDGDIIESKERIKEICRAMPYKTLETLSIDIMLKVYPDDDGIEGLYKCPRCNNKIISEIKDGIDNRDFITSLKKIYEDCCEEFNTFELTENVELKNGKEVIDIINSVQLRTPTIQDHIQAQSRYGNSDSYRLQLSIYAECITKINDVDIDKTWKNRYAMYLFENIDTTDLNKIAQAINNYGYDYRIQKTCNNCNKEFFVNMNTSGFFASALQLQ